MKALILAGGRGKRLGSASKDINKCMLEVAGKPLIEYSLQHVFGIKVIDSIVIVVGYKAEDIINKYGDSYFGKPIKYVVQEEQRGLVHAIELAKEAMGKSDFMLTLGDEYMANPHHAEFISAFSKEDIFALCGVVIVKNRELIKKTYSLVQSDDKKIYRLIEKPNNPDNNFMGTGNCIFKNKIFDYIEHTPINKNRKEKELPDLIQCAIDDGRIVKSFVICQEYFNVNLQEELDKAKSYFTHF
jgi:glucose-1-phosphate thymidylyltransferase